MKLLELSLLGFLIGKDIDKQHDAIKTNLQKVKDVMRKKDARIAELEDELQVAVVVHKSLDDRIKELEEIIERQNQVISELRLVNAFESVSKKD